MTRFAAPLVPHANDQDEVRVALRDAEPEERLRALTPEELAHWAETGEWPASSART